MKQFYFLFLLTFLMLGCNKYETFDGFTQGTTYHIIYERKGLFSTSPVKMKGEVDSLLAHFDLSLSAYIPNSIISRINRNDSLVISDPYFVIVFKKALDVFQDSEGAFDITVGPLVNAWGFGPGRKKDMDSLLVDSLLHYVGMNKIKLIDNKLVKEISEMKLDVNAIAQGYSVDVVSKYFEEKRINNFLVEIGGELRSKGTKKNEVLWKVGVDKPFDNNYIPGQNLQIILKLSDCSLATSGNYRKYFEKDGVKYSHSIDPKTGYPVMDRLLSATIIAKDCITADAYATACMVMGLEKSKVFISERDDLEAYLIYSSESNDSFKTWQSKNFEELIWKEENTQDF